jgi:PilZ domain
MPTRNESRYLEDKWGSDEIQVNRTSRTADLDRRNTHRVALQACVTYVNEGGECDQKSRADGQLVELSMEGCRIVGSQPVATGSSLTLSIRFSDGYPPLRLCRTQVCWSDGDTFGVKFAKLTDNERQRVQNLVWKFASKAGESEDHTGFRFA